MRASREVANAVEPLARLVQRMLEREVVAVGDEQGITRSTLSQLRRQRSEEPVQRGWVTVGSDERVQRVVERPGAVQRRDRLRDARQLGALRLEPEAPCKLGGEWLGVAADHDRHLAGEEKRGDFLEVLRRGRRPRTGWRRFLSQ